MDKKRKNEIRAFMNSPERHELTRMLEQRLAQLKQQDQERKRRESS